MKFLPFSARLVAIGVIACILDACAFAPGMAFSPDEPLNPNDPESVVSVIPITSETVRENNSLVEEKELKIGERVKGLLASSGPYRLGVGDVISIIVWDHPELVLPSQTYAIGSGTVTRVPGSVSPPQGFVITASGTVQFPYAGIVKLEGLTIDEAQALITEKLAKYINDPQVTVRVQAFRSQRVYVDGKVKEPGVFPLTDVPLSIVEAINHAGGVLPDGDPSQIILTRQGISYPVDLIGLLKEGIDPAKILLRNGDLIRVGAREENKIFVVGEVTKPTVVTLRNGRLTLNEALGDAGGVSPISSDPRHIYVVRNDNNTKNPAVYHLEAKSPVALALAESFLLQPKDVVYVDSAPIVRWSRFINNLLPGFNTAVNSARLAQ